MIGTKRRLQGLLGRLGIHQRLRGSRLYDAYWAIADHRILARRSQEVRFYQNLLRGLPDDPLIFDIGANHGSKVDIFLRLGARVVAVDPDETNEHILRERFWRYRLRRKPVYIVRKAASDRVANEVMWIDEPGSAKNTLNPKWVAALREDTSRFGHSLTFAGEKRVETTTLDDLIAAYGTPHFIKIDVEGFEHNVLKGLHQRIPFLSFEVNLPDFLPEGNECISLLSGLAPEGCFNYTSDCQGGLALEKWVEAPQLRDVLSVCRDDSVEVFWTTFERGLFSSTHDTPRARLAIPKRQQAQQTLNAS